MLGDKPGAIWYYMAARIRTDEITGRCIQAKNRVNIIAMTLSAAMRLKHLVEGKADSNLKSAIAFIISMVKPVLNYVEPLIYNYKICRISTYKNIKEAIYHA